MTAEKTTVGVPLGRTIGTGEFDLKLGDEPAGEPPAAEPPPTELEALRAFAQGVMEVWPIGDLDGGTLQDLAVKHGLLKPEIRYTPCGEGCTCAEYATTKEFEAGVECYRKTPLLTGVK